MASSRKLNARAWLAGIGIPIVIGVAMVRDRDSTEKALGALMICDGLLRLYSLATNDRDEVAASQLRSAALSDASSVLLGASLMSFQHGVGMVLLALAAVALLAGWLSKKTFVASQSTIR